MGILDSPLKAKIAIVDQEAFNFVEFDATISETHTGTAQVTDHPVEGAENVVDHIRRMPEELQIRGVVSNFPILFLASFRATPSVPGTDPASRAEEAYFFLTSIKDNGQLVNVTTLLRDYSNMAITSISVARDKDSSNIVDISLTLREILVATTEVVEPPTPADGNKSASTNLGRKAKKPAPPAVASKTQSLLSRLFSAFGG